MTAQHFRDAVVHAFIAGESARSGTMVSNGGSICSYNVCLASRDEQGNIYVTECMDNRYSVTTSSHQRAIFDCLPGSTPILDRDRTRIGFLRDLRYRYEKRG